MAEMEKTTPAEVESPTLELNDFQALLQQEFKPKTDRMQQEVEGAVRTLAEYALKDVSLVSTDAVRTIEAIKAAIDRKLTEQVNAIIHHPDFQQLEGAWRGLHHLVYNTESDSMLKIQVLQVKKKEVSKMLRKYKGSRWDQSPLFKKIYGEEFDLPGGEPYGCLVADYYFDNSPPDTELLGAIAKIAAAAHAPFIAGAAPSVMGMESWDQLSNPADLAKLFETPDYAAWRALRESEDARYLGLAMPRFLSRQPYGAKSEVVEEFDFEEDTEGADSSKYTWANAAYAMASNITRAFKTYGWCTQIRGRESGGVVEELPVHSFPTDDGGVDAKCPTEIAIGGRREMELANLGFMPLSHYKNTNYAVFMGAQSLQKPAKYDDPDATASANLSSRMPYLFATCRFAHYLKCIVRDKVGSFKEREDLQKWLQTWIIKYVDGDPVNSSDMVKARKPLAGAEVVVEEVEGNPGYYNARFYLRPHYQLEGVTVALSLVSKLPSVKQ